MGSFGGYSVDDITLVIDMLLEQIDRPDAIEAGIRAGLLLEKLGQLCTPQLDWTGYTFAQGNANLPGNNDGSRC